MSSIALGLHPEVAEQPVGGRLVVVRGDREDAVGAEVARAQREVDRFLGRVAACAGEDRHRAVRALDASSTTRTVLARA